MEWRASRLIIGRNGVSTEKSLPEEWSPEKNVKWKTAIPGRGRPSTVVWGDRIFLTTDIEGGKAEGNQPPKHLLGGTPFRHPDSVGTDAGHTLTVLCLDRKTGKIQTIGMGPGASPVLAGELLILQCDSSDQKSKVVAPNRKNGELVWRTERTTDATW